MLTGLPKLLPKKLEDELFGQLDQRMIHLEELFENRLISDEVFETILTKADAAWSSLVFVNQKSIALGRSALDEVVDAFIHEIVQFDNRLYALLASKELIGTPVFRQE